MHTLPKVFIGKVRVAKEDDRAFVVCVNSGDSLSLSLSLVDVQVPIMVRSSFCQLHQKNDRDLMLLGEW